MSATSDRQNSPQPSDGNAGPGNQAVPEKSDASTSGSNHDCLPELPVFHDVPELPDYASMTLEEQLGTSRLAHLSDEELGMNLPGAARLYNNPFADPSYQDESDRTIRGKEEGDDT